MEWFKSKQKDENKTIKDLCERMGNVEGKLVKLEIENTALRDKVLRKLQKHYDEEKSDNPMEQPKPLNTFSPFSR
jgi:hypothetical protein